MASDCHTTMLDFVSLINTIPVPAVCVAGEQVCLNHAAEKLTGYSRDDLPTLTEWFAKLYGPDQQKIRSIYEADRAAGFPEPRDVAITCKDGSTRIVEFIASGVAPTIWIMNDVTKRRQTETALRESEELWKFAFEGSGDAVWDWNIQKNTTRFSRRYVDMLGYSQDEFTQHPDAWVKRVHPDDLPLVLEEHQRHFREETSSMAIEYRILCKDGTYKWILGRGKVVIRDADGKPIRMVGTHTDISAQKAVEAALKESEEKYRLLIENASEGIVVCQGDYFKYVNPQAAKICGYSTEELLNKPFSELIHPDDRTKVIERYKSRLAGMDVPASLELRIITADGRICWLLLNAVLISWNGAPATLDFFTDNTEQKKTEEALRSSETKFARVFQAAPVLLTISDLHSGMYLDVNDKFLEVTGYSRTEVIGKSSLELGWISASDRESLVKHLNRDGKISNIELKCHGKNRSVVYCLFSGEVLHLNGQQRLLSIAQDITARKRIEETLQNFNHELEARVSERTAQLKSALRHQESFAYSISHDLRSPLRAVEGYSHILMEECADRLTPKATGYLKRMSNNVCRMGKLIDDLLTYSRLSMQPIQLGRVNTYSLVKEVCAELTAERDMTKIRLNVARLPHCQADPTLLRQVFTNLISNALKFTATRDLATIEVGSFPQGKTTVYYVRDNGVGFDMQYAEMLFGVFQRLHGMEEFEGSGVGLAIAQNIIDRHGGSIWAESVPDSGAAFFFTLAAIKKIPPGIPAKR